MSIASNLLSQNQIVYVCTFEVCSYAANIDIGINSLHPNDNISGSHVVI